MPKKLSRGPKSLDDAKERVEALEEFIRLRNQGWTILQLAEHFGIAQITADVIQAANKKYITYVSKNGNKRGE